MRERKGPPSKGPVRLGVLVSGGGSNLEAILQAIEKGTIDNAVVALVISSRADAAALTRARTHGVASAILRPEDFGSDGEFQKAIEKRLRQAQVDVVCLAGYLRKLGANVLRQFSGRILNIHPALLPKFGGAGMYGHRVHEAVLKAGEKESGCSVHIVDEEFDHGPVLAQARVPVQPGDTPEVLAARVLEQEHQLFPRVIQSFCRQLLEAKEGNL